VQIYAGFPKWKNPFLGDAFNDIGGTIFSMKKKYEVIRKYLLSSQRKVCLTANRFTPSIFNAEYQVDIADMFTDLDLLKISNNIEKEDADMFTDLDQLTISKSRKNEDATQTTLKQVLDDIKFTPACKALIEGESGVGKSTLLRYIAYNWAKNGLDETFKGKIVFLVNIQDIDINESILDAILSKINLHGFKLETGLKEDPILIEQFIWNHSNEIVLLLDGLDELKDGSESPIRIFKCQAMCECKVVLTSRSEKIYEFINASNLHVKVQGFSTENIGKYIRKHFDFFRKPLLGDSLIEELQLDSNHKHQEIYSMCKNPLLLLSVSIMWEKRKNLVADKSDLFKEVFRCILNQFIDKQTVKEQKISTFEDTPERFVNAMALLGKYFYKGLKKNQLSINRREMKEDKELVALALKLGFVYKDTSKLKSNFEEIFTTRHKLILESLVGFYLCKLCQIQGLKNKCSNDMGTLFEPLTDNEWKMISRSKHFHVTKVFAIGFLGANAGIFLNHWITNDISTYRSLMEYLRCVNKVHMDTVEKAVIGHMTREDLIIKPHINDICKSLRQFIHNIIPELEISQKEHFIRLMIRIRECFSWPESKMINSFEYFLREMSSEEKGRMLAHILIAVPEQKIIFEKICSIICENDINYLTDECQRLFFKYDVTECTLSSLSTASFVVHLFSNAPQLNIVTFRNCITGAVMNNVIRECLNRRVKLELQQLCFIGTDLSDIDGSSFASLFISPKLIILNMNNCSLSSVILNDMIEECSSRGVKLELKLLAISDNNLSKIDGASFASLFISPKLNILGMNNCSLSSVILNDMIEECSSRGVKLELKLLAISGNNLSNIDGASFASLFITSKLSKLVMNNCNLSCVVMNDMIRECSRREVKLELEELYVSGNNLSNIDGSSFASLFITSKLSKLGMNNCSLSGVIMNDMIRECSSRGVKLELVELYVNGNNLSNINRSSFASLFIMSKLCKLSMNNCSLSGVIMNDMIRECSSRGVKLELEVLAISANNLSNIDGSSFASLCITSKLSILDMDNCNLSDVIMNDMIRECSSRGI
ncbi:NLR family CARD domain-containing protein 4-like, partial [Anneissia japonica]|uniref:NLR family CARD domain-containing protein 4-like n=1 Tax=Anneissia japonica TaxID=1529436 RepID=UPI0014259FF6